MVLSKWKLKIEKKAKKKIRGAIKAYLARRELKYLTLLCYEKMYDPNNQSFYYVNHSGVHFGEGQAYSLWEPPEFMPERYKKSPHEWQPIPLPDNRCLFANHRKSSGYIGPYPAS